VHQGVSEGKRIEVEIIMDISKNWLRLTNINNMSFHTSLHLGNRTTDFSHFGLEELQLD